MASLSGGGYGLGVDGADNSILPVSPGLSVADVGKLRSNSLSRSRKGEIVKSADAAWYVFDDLSCDQAEDLLRQHGDHMTYLVAHFHDPESYGLSIRLNENDDVVVYKHYAIGISAGEYHTQGIPGGFPTIESVVESVGIHLELTLVPIFHRFNHDTSDFEITMTEVDEKPPEYSQASKYPEAARKPLPLIVPVYPTLRRMMGAGNEQNEETSESMLTIDASASPSDQHHGCCWKAFHTDVNGKWYKPHKAGPITGAVLVVGWIIFLILFGWIVGLAMILVLLLVLCACCINYICTGRCEVEEGEDDAVEDGNRPSSNYQQQ